MDLPRYAPNVLRFLLTHSFNFELMEVNHYLHFPSHSLYKLVSLFNQYVLTYLIHYFLT